MVEETRNIRVVATGKATLLPSDTDIVALAAGIPSLSCITDPESFADDIEQYREKNWDYRPSDDHDAAQRLSLVIAEIGDAPVRLKDLLDFVGSMNGIKLDVLGPVWMLNEDPAFIIENMPAEGKQLIALDQNSNDGEGEDHDAVNPGAVWEMGTFEMIGGELVFSNPPVTQQSFSPGTRFTFAVAGIVLPE